MPSFYPSPAFGWTFYAALIGFVGVAAYTDLGTLKIPKKLTLTMLAAGLVVSLVRGAWLGSLLEGTEQKVWLFANTPVLGALDGLLCALAGFAASLAVFLVLWVLGVMGGGDVKLAAALGAWVGPTQMAILFLGMMVVFVLLGTALLVRKLFRRGVQRTVFDAARPGPLGSHQKKTPAGAQRRDQLLAYSLPVAIATALLVPLLIIHDVYGPSLKKNQPSEQASAKQ
jgi:prepilin peptidase CpaA